MLLFLNTLMRVTGIELTEEKISYAAQITFVNILFLSLLCTIADGVRRRLTVERPVRSGPDSVNEFDVIADYFNKMAQELSGTETLRMDFIANVSHELKTPLAVIQNYGAMLQQPGLSEEKRIEYAGAVADAARRLASLITNILKLNKLENQQIYPVAETYDLGEQLCECLLSFENAWEKKIWRSTQT